jgi:hypothetical protein
VANRLDGKRVNLIGRKAMEAGRLKPEIETHRSRKK